MTGFARRRMPALVLAVLAVLGTGAASCGQSGSRAELARLPSPTATPPGPSGPGQRGTLHGSLMRSPTHLRLLVEHTLIDVDAGTHTLVGATRWLRPAGAPALFVEEVMSAREFGMTRVETVAPPAEPIATMVRATLAPHARLAAAADGRGIWIAEYRSRTRCTVRQVWLDGRERRPAREVPCGTDVLAETEAGLWVSHWVSAYNLAGRTVTSSRMRDETTFSLLDPDTLRVRARYAEARVIGGSHVLTMDDTEQNLALRDLRNGTSVTVAKPTTISFWGFGTKLVSNVSPDGRFALFRFGDHSSYPHQTLDVWVLDLVTATWQRVPGMPVDAALKYCFEDWTGDGRLALLGDFPGAGAILATWRPGDAQLASRPLPLPPGLYDGGLGAVYFW